MKSTAFLLDHAPNHPLRSGEVVTLDIETAVSSWHFYQQRFPQHIQPRFGLPVFVAIPSIETAEQRLQLDKSISDAVAVAAQATPIVSRIPEAYIQPAPPIFESQKTDSTEDVEIPKLLTTPNATSSSTMVVKKSALAEFWRSNQSAVMRHMGTGMVAVSMATVFFFSSPILSVEIQSAVRNIAQSLQTFSNNQPLTARANERGGEGAVGASVSAEIRETPVPAVPVPEKQFQLIIPKIGVDSKVIANVDAGNATAYQDALKRGVAHAQGSGLPGEDGGHNKTIFIFGHSTDAPWNIQRMNALFYSIKDLQPGDEMTVWFWGVEHTYRVKEQKIVASNDVSFLQPQLEKEQLILQTCWPPGTINKRLLIFAEPIEKSSGSTPMTDRAKISQVTLP